MDIEDFDILNYLFSVSDIDYFIAERGPQFISRLKCLSILSKYSYPRNYGITLWF